MLTQEYLKSILTYTPSTGVFVWKLQRGSSTPGSVAGGMVGGGRRAIRIDKTKYLEHRLAFLWMTGKLPLLVDHINGDPSDNRWVNIRESTTRQNQYNRRISKNCKSGVKGVHWNVRDKRWIARINVDGRQVNVGHYPDLIGAELAVKKARNKLHGEFSNHG